MKSNTTINDSLAELLVDLINSEMKDSAYLLGRDKTPANISDYVSSGSSLLDLIISNRKNGGFPTGRISVLAGLESSGKSLIAAHALSSTQKKGGVAIYIDNESSCSDEFLKAIGLDLSKLVYIHLEAIEDIFSTIEKIIAVIREKHPDTLITIVVDSIAAASSKKELEGNYDKEIYGGDKPAIISKALRKIVQKIARYKVALIFTNQLRMNINSGGFGDPYKPTSGMALPFYSSMNIRLTKMGKILHGENVVGVKVKAIVNKSKISPPYRSCEFNVYFDRGICDYEGWFNVLERADIIEKPKKARSCRMIFDNVYEKIEEIKKFIKDNDKIFSEVDDIGFSFKRSDWDDLLENNPEFKEYAYWLLCNLLILKYDYAIENVEEVLSNEEEEC